MGIQERRCGSSHLSGKETRWWQSFTVGGNAGKRRGGGSHSQWAGTRERGEVAAVIRSGRARGREVRWWQSFAVGGHAGER